MLRKEEVKIMKKKLLALIGVATLSVSLLTGCGSKGTDDKTIKVAATAVPHAEILEQEIGRAHV